MPLFNRNKEKIALALGGGAARGLANIGVLKVLDREKVPLDLITGSSIGALIGAAYGLGMHPEEMEEAAIKFTWDELADFSISRMSLLKGKKLENIIEQFTDNKAFKDMKIPFGLTTTNIETGKELIYTDGDLQKLIKASCSWPGFFPPVDIEKKKLVDGGIKNSIPVRCARELGATKVIAVHIGFCIKQGKLDNLFQMFMQSIQILGKELDNYQSKEADVIIEPALFNIDQFAFNQAKRIIDDAVKATERAMPEIRKKMHFH